MTQKQANEVLALIEKARFDKAFAKLDSFGVDDFAVNSLREEFKTGHEGAKFHQRLAVVVQGLVTNKDDNDEEENKKQDVTHTNSSDTLERNLIRYVGISLSILIVCLIVVWVWRALIPTEVDQNLQGEDKKNNERIAPIDTSNNTKPIDTLKTGKKENNKSNAQLNKRIETVNGVNFTMITIPNQNYEMMETEVTQALWVAVMGNNPSHNQPCPTCPVENVSWNDIVNKFLPELKKFTSKDYRLPSEAEWEYAAKGGKSYKYAGSNNQSEVGYLGNPSGSTKPVKQLKKNDYELFDMSGNVFEWTSNEINGGDAKMRGGSFHHNTTLHENGDSFHKNNGTKHIGFRLCLTAK